MLFNEVKKEDSVEYTVQMGRVNLIAIFMIIPILIIFLVPYLLLWNFDILKIGYKLFLKNIFLLVFVGIILHELLHGITWAILTKKGFNQIKFGINWKYLSPYTHFKEPLKIKYYLAGALMPLIILGIIPAVYGIIMGDGFFLIFGIFFTWAAAGDIISSIRLLRLPMNIFVQDHPKELGFIVFDQATNGTL
ncbi:MAG: hypothetical protein A2W99_06120 [Bacteroidetes bacterium GWF2_33_16]|nr:MAG: hypothetical protein A2X00_12775 [Bacteroidetes bacterium GWE2_32_14]OFY05258.1 MAG: hypothetical protein A2W99_06120 [Bacteroidetes bacterium GWF2_33_16]